MTRSAWSRGFIVILGLLASLPTVAQTLITYSRAATPGSAAESLTAVAPPYRPQVAPYNDDPNIGVFLMFIGDVSDPDPSISIVAPPGQRLAPGIAYEETTFPGFTAGPALVFSEPLDCLVNGGRFIILDMAFGTGGTVDRLAVDFEQRCLKGAPVFGAVRINSAIPTTPPAGANVPYPFTLQAQSPVVAGARVVSNTISVMGVSTAVPISVIGGEYSVNGGAFTASPGLVRNHDEITARLTASTGAGQTTNATLDIGGVSSTLSVKTYIPGEALSALHVKSPVGDFVGQGQEKIFIAPRHEFVASRNFNNGVHIHVRTAEATLWDLDFALPADALPVAGRYTGATRYPFQTSTIPGLDLSGDGRGCNKLSGDFTIREAAFAANGDVISFAADLVQRCEDVQPPLVAEVRFNSTVPLDALSGVAPTVNDCITYAELHLDSDGDGSPDCTEAAEGIDPQFKDNDVFNNPRLFVQQIYRDFLGREGDETGVAYWANEIATGHRTRTQLVQLFVHTPEFAQSVSPIVRLYLTTFLRWPDVDGLRYWIAAYRGGMSLDAMADIFTSSPEFMTRYGALDNGAFVTLVYQNVLGRTADGGGYDTWKALLDDGVLTRGQLMQRFAGSPEFVSLSSSEVTVAMTYFGMLRREPDASGFSFWVNYLDAGNSEATLLDGFYGSQEYRNRFF
jgi:hypothetical protein